MRYWRSPWGFAERFTKDLPDGWYVATVDDGVTAGPFPTLRVAKTKMGSEQAPKKQGNLYHAGREYVGRRDDLVDEGFEYVHETWTPER